MLRQRPAASGPWSHPSGYYDWMLRGEALYRALEPSHPLASGLPSPGPALLLRDLPPRHHLPPARPRLEPAAAPRKRLSAAALLA